jgi:hypothetical protein
MMKMLLAVPALGLALTASLVPSAAPAQSFGVKPGAWENTVTIAGLTIPPDVLAKMPPERRAMVEQQLGANGGGQPQVHRRCVKQEDLDQAFMPNTRSSCEIEVVSRTTTKIVMHTTCSSPVPSTGTMTWEAKTPELVVGTIDQDVGGRKVHIGTVCKWLGASCGGIPGSGG